MTNYKNGRTNQTILMPSQPRCDMQFFCILNFCFWYFVISSYIDIIFISFKTNLFFFRFNSIDEIQGLNERLRRVKRMKENKCDARKFGEKKRYENNVQAKSNKKSKPRIFNCICLTILFSVKSERNPIESLIYYSV